MRGLFALGDQFVELVAALGQLLSGHADGGVQFHALVFVSAAFLFDQIWRFLDQLRWRHERLAAGYGGKAGRSGKESDVLGAVLAQGGHETGRIHLEQKLAGFDLLAFLDEDFRNDAAVEALHYLHLAGRDDLAFAAGHFVELGEGGPSQQNNDGNEGGPHGDAAAAQLLLGHGPLGVGQIVGVVVNLALLGAVEDTVEGA